MSLWQRFGHVWPPWPLQPIRSRVTSFGHVWSPSVTCDRLGTLSHFVRIQITWGTSRWKGQNHPLKSICANLNTTAINHLQCLYSKLLIFITPHSAHCRGYVSILSRKIATVSLNSTWHLWWISLYLFGKTWLLWTFYGEFHDEDALISSPQV
jgi:hypothetical protein